MDLQVQELLDRIKAEGVDAAKAEAARIVADAESRANALVVAAEKAAAETERQAERRIAAMEAASRAALTQASRDTLIGLKGRVQAFAESMIRADAAAAFGPDTIAAILPGLLSGIAAQGEDRIEVLLDPTALTALDASLAARLARELGKGVEFKPFTGIDAGFRISAQGGAVQYDYSAESVAAIVASRVNARLADCLRDAAKGN